MISQPPSVDQLPPGYQYLDPTEVDPAVLSGLDKLVFNDDGNSPDYIAHLIGEVLLYVCVGDSVGTPIAIGYLERDGDRATLDGLAVHPDHTHRGIARAIVKRRVDYADGIGIKELNVVLTATNNLFHYYQSLNFNQVPSSELVWLRRYRPASRRLT